MRILVPAAGPCASFALLLTLLVSAPPAFALKLCPDGTGAKQAVMGYLTAMHQNRFKDAYDFVSERMTDGRSRVEWSDLQARAYQPGKVEIYAVDPRDPVAAEGDSRCKKKAVVPNVLSSRDKINVHGTVELEIYRVIHHKGQWLVDEQETLFEDEQIAVWFPELTETGTDSSADAGP